MTSPHVESKSVPTLGRRIASLRVLHGLTQKEAAERLGVHQVVLSRVETGARRPSLDLLTAAAELYGTTIDYIVRGETAHASAA